MEEKIVNILVSIIIPSLNVRPYIHECMESVVHQTLREIEVICVDAGSTDGTLEVLHQYAISDERIKIINSDKKSYGYQMNLGIKEAKGEYIGIVEPDDFIDVTMYQQMYEKVKNNCVDFIKGGYFEYSEIGKDLSIKCLKNIPQNISEMKINLRENRNLGMLDLNHIWAALYRRDFLRKKDVRFNETKGASYQDTSFSILVGLLADSCWLSYDCFYYYRTDNENSSVKSDDKYNCVIDEYKYIEDELIRHNIYTPDNRHLVLQQKLITYRWNYLRLSSFVREKFFLNIQKEMSTYNEDEVLYGQLNGEQKQILELLTVPDKIFEYQEKQVNFRKQVEQLLESVITGCKYVIVGCGQYGERFLLIQKILKKNYVEAICDNSLNLQGRKKDQYVILSVEEAVNKHKNDRFIIANKNHADAIFEQLLGLGINQENIWIFNKMLPTSELIQLCKSIKYE